MPRAPFQVVAFPVRVIEGVRQYVLFHRRVESFWQPISGGGELGETPLQAVQCESAEEAGVPADSTWVLLQTSVTVPVTHFADRDHWDAALLVIPVSHYAVIVPAFEIVLSHEHSAYQWLPYEEAQALLKWDSDRTALWEIEMRFLQGRLTV